MGYWGFIDTWLAKRKEKKREKKKRAISARAQRAATKAIIGRNIKVSKGGVAFNFELDKRVPTPFRGFTPRPASRMHLSEDDKIKALEAITARRQEMLDLKTKFARENARKREARCATARPDPMLSEDNSNSGDNSAREECQTSTPSPRQ